MNALAKTGIRLHDHEAPDHRLVKRGYGFYLSLSGSKSRVFGPKDSGGRRGVGME